MVDYLAAVELLIIPFVLRLGTSAPLAKGLAVDTGLAVILVSLLTDYKLGLVRIIPFRGVSGMKTTSILIGLAGLVATALVAAEVQKHASAATSDQSTQTVVDAQGNLRVPEDYRTAYQFLGAWAIAADQGKGSQQLHVVYVSPGTIAACRKDGHFLDGSVLVKEVFETATEPMTTGTVSQPQEPGEQRW